MSWFLFAFPVIGAAIGWLTNHLAVRMLFRPRKPVGLPGLKIQGLIPRRQNEIAERVADVVSRELMVAERVQECLKDPALLEPLREEVERRVGKFLRQKLDSLPTLIRSVMPESIESGVRDSIVEEIMKVVPEMMEQLAGRLEQNVDVHGIVVERMKAMDLDQLEHMVLSIAKRELRAIEILGGVIGFLVGCVQAALSYFIFSSH